jgi:hypothetical protein
MTVSDLWEQPCSKSDNAIKVACSKLLTACSNNWEQAVRTQLVNRFLAERRRAWGNWCGLNEVNRLYLYYSSLTAHCYHHSARRKLNLYWIARRDILYWCKVTTGRTETELSGENLRVSTNTARNYLLPYRGCIPHLYTRKSPEHHRNRVSRVFQCLFSRHLPYSICKSRVHLHRSYQRVPRWTASINWVYRTAY